MNQHKLAHVQDLKSGEKKAYELEEHQILLANVNNQFYAVSATCPHYGAPLEQGVLHHNRLFCPWHHACFDIKNGHLQEPPALDNLVHYPVEIKGDEIWVALPSEPSDRLLPKMTKPEKDTPHYVIIGAGAAGLAAAQAMREGGFSGKITMITKEASNPYDRPNLSKAYLAGEAPAEWMPLRPEEFFNEYGIQLKFNKLVTNLDVADKTITLSDAEIIHYDKVLVATGSIPKKLDVPGHHLKNIFTLRSYQDADQIIAAADNARQIVVIGSGFIGMEVAYSLLQRNKSVTIISRDKVPFQKVLGQEIGQLFKSQHEQAGTKFISEAKVIEFTGNGSVSGVKLENQEIPADMVVVGVGVYPSTDFVKGVKLMNDQSIVVDRFFSCHQGVYAAGDIATYDDAYFKEKLRIEHWRTALQQGRIAGLNMAGQPTEYTSTSFFWTRQAGLSLGYVGHATQWDEVVFDGDVSTKNFLAYYFYNNKLLAVAGNNRPRELDAINSLMTDRQLPDASIIKSQKINWLDLLERSTNQ